MLTFLGWLFLLTYCISLEIKGDKLEKRCEELRIKIIEVENDIEKHRDREHNIMY